MRMESTNQSHGYPAVVSVTSGCMGGLGISMGSEISWRSIHARCFNNQSSSASTCDDQSRKFAKFVELAFNGPRHLLSRIACVYIYIRFVENDVLLNQLQVCHRSCTNCNLLE